MSEKTVKLILLLPTVCKAQHVDTTDQGLHLEPASSYKNTSAVRERSAFGFENINLSWIGFEQNQVA